MTSNVDHESGGSYKQLIWDGKNPSWIVWETKMLARAVTKKWYDVMVGLPEDVLADSMILDDDNDAHAINIKKRDANRRGYSNLISPIDTTKRSGRAAFSVVRMAKNETSPMGALQVSCGVNPVSTQKRLEEALLALEAGSLTPQQLRELPSLINKAKSEAFAFGHAQKDSTRPVVQSQTTNQQVQVPLPVQIVWENARIHFWKIVVVRNLPKPRVVD
jgi:hypothetical protein